MKKLFLALAIASCFQYLNAQELPRKAGLGVAYYTTVPDSLVSILDYKKGAVVQTVVPGSTAAAMNLQAMDIILSVNQQAIQSPADLARSAKTLREGQAVSLTVSRNKQLISFTGKAIARPYEKSETANITYGAFAYKGGWVRTIYKRQKEKAPLGTIYFLQGLPCYSMDNFTEKDKTKQAIDALVDRGFAVYRMEKADMGDNLNQAPCVSMGFDAELDMYRAGYRNLLQLPGIDTSNIFLFGHSMGGVTAPLLAKEFQPKAVVVYGTVFKPWMEYMLDAFRIQMGYFGEDPQKLDNALKKYKPFIADYFEGRQSIESIAANPTGLEALQLILSYDPATGLAASGRSPLVFKEINAHDLSKAWQQTSSYVLAIYGECDIAANNDADHKALVSWHNRTHPGKASFWLAPGTTHTFEEIGTMEDYIRWQSTPSAYYQYAENRFNPKVFDYVGNWLKSLLQKG